MAPASDDRFDITRTFAAPRELVFRAWTQPEHLLRWFGPAGFTMIRAEMDLRPGGRFHYGLRGPDGGEMWGLWIFREVDAPAYLEFVSSFSDPAGGATRHPMAPDWPLEMLSTLRLTAGADDTTTLYLTSEAHEATAAERAAFAAGKPSMQGGWTGTLDALEAHLRALQA